jgi:transposase
VENDTKGLAALGRRLVGLTREHIVRIGFEASGGYERKLAIMLDRLGLNAWLLDPARVRSFGRAERQIAKTDPLDAGLIARALVALHGQIEPYRHDPTALRMAEHVRLRDLAVSQSGQLANQLETLADPAMRRLIAGQIARIKAMILRIEKAMANLVAASPDLARRERLLRSAPGVGPIVAATLIAYLPEGGRLSSRQVASLAGLAPFDRQSGKSNRQARCSGGRPALRRALYIAAIVIIRSGKHPIAAIAKRLRDAGKPFKVAAIAVARKLLVALNSMLKHNVPFNA